MTSFIQLGRRAFLTAGSALLSACSPLGLLNTFTPADAGGRLAASGLAGPYDFLPLDDPRSIAAFPRLPETQPVSFASAAAPRVFLATGDEDETVRPRNSISLAQKLRAAGAAIELRIYPGLGHAGILLALNAGFRNRAPILADIVRFARDQADQAPLAATP